MATTQSDQPVEVSALELWASGPPHELFKELRGRCPVHRTERIERYPDEEGFWSVTTAEDVRTVSLDWKTYSSELGGVTFTTDVFPLEFSQSMFIGMDPPKHDRIKALFQRGFTPKRIAGHEDHIRRITRDALDQLDGRMTCDLVRDVAQPVVSRVIGSFMGISEHDDASWARIINSTLAPRTSRSPPKASTECWRATSPSCSIDVER